MSPYIYIYIHNIYIYTVYIYPCITCHSQTSKIAPRMLRLQMWVQRIWPRGASFIDPQFSPSFKNKNHGVVKQLLETGFTEIIWGFSLGYNVSPLLACWMGFCQQVPFRARIGHLSIGEMWIPVKVSTIWNTNNLQRSIFPNCLQASFIVESFEIYLCWSLTNLVFQEDKFVSKLHMKNVSVTVMDNSIIWEIHGL